MIDAFIGVSYPSTLYPFNNADLTFGLFTKRPKFRFAMKKDFQFSPECLRVLLILFNLMVR